MLWAVKEVAGLRGMRRVPEKIRSSSTFTGASPFTALASLNSSDPGDKVEQSSRNNRLCEANGNDVLIQEKKKGETGKGGPQFWRKPCSILVNPLLMKKKMTSTLIMSWEWNIASLYFLGWVCRQSVFDPVGWRLELLGLCCEYSHSVEICPKQEIGRHFMRHDLIVWDPYKTGRVQPLPSNETK